MGVADGAVQSTIQVVQRELRECGTRKNKNIDWGIKMGMNVLEWDIMQKTKLRSGGLVSEESTLKGYGCVRDRLRTTWQGEWNSRFVGERYVDHM